jgi:hypothetical protein
VVEAHFARFVYVEARIVARHYRIVCNRAHEFRAIACATWNYGIRIKYLLLDASDSL